MGLTILNVAYPFAPVGPDAVGGAEQVLSRLEAALAEAGHHSIVVAQDGSVTRGTLMPTPPAKGLVDDVARERAWQWQREAIGRALARWPVDLVHLHGIDCLEYLPPAGVPALITLHLPPRWYPQEIFQLSRPQTFLNCVSSAQRRACPPCAYLLPEIENGVPDDLFKARHVKRGFALSLGRICPEKGFHLALEAAARARVPLLLAGEVFGYEAHERYFRTEIRPRLNRWSRFLGPVGWRRKRRLLAAAQCLLAPSLVAETSSLVTMEALACGTPVVAFPSGALADLVADGQTGFLVRNESEMAEAIHRCGELKPSVCRAAARRRFGLGRMIDKYFEVYRSLAENSSKVETVQGVV